MTQQNRLSNLIEELRRRRVFRVAAFYGGIAFVILQVIESSFDYLHIPEWIGSLLVVMLLLGFPIAMILAWVFDITPEGIVRTTRADVSGDYPDVERKAQPLIGNKALAIIAVAAIAFGLWGTMVRKPADQPITLAVLPFRNYSEQGGDWFADGFTDIITSQLAKLTDLRVIARTSTMHYKNSDLSASEIAEELGATMVLEGSILRAGGKVLITGQLIDASTDSHIWTDSYEREDEDVIALQTDVAIAIARALDQKLTPEDEALLSILPTKNPEAYDHYLKGLNLRNNLYLHPVSNDSALVIRSLAAAHFEKAVSFDSTFGDAHYQSVLEHSNLYFSRDTTQSRLEKATHALNEAERLIPGTPALQMARGVYYYYAEREFRKALAELEPLLTSGSGDAELIAIIGYLYRRVGRWTESLEMLKMAADLDPRNAIVVREVLFTYRVLHRYAEAERYFERLRFLGASENYETRARIAIEAYGDLDKAWQLIQKGYDELGVGYLESSILSIALIRRDYLAMESFLDQPNELPAWEQAGWHSFASHIQGNIEAARIYAEESISLFQSDSTARARYNNYGILAQLAAVAGDSEKTLEWGEESIALMSPEVDYVFGPGVYAQVGLSFVSVGLIGRGFDLLEEAMSYPNLITKYNLIYAFELDDVRDHPRYLALMEKLSGGR